MSNKNNHNPDNIYIVSVTNNKDKLHEEWDFISEKKQDKNNTVQCICNNDIYAEINIYKNNINNTTIFVGSGCKKKLELKNINNQKNILINKYKKRYKKLNIDNQTFKNIKDFNKYEEYVIKKICAIIVDELNKKMFTIKILYNLRNEINIIFENKKEYNNIFILINNLINCKYTNDKCLIYNNISHKQINYLINKNEFNYLLFTNNNVIFRLSLIQFIFNICNENKTNYYLAPNTICNENTNLNIIYNDNKEFIEHAKITNKEEFLDDYNNKLFIKQYNNIDEITFNNNFLLIHKELIKKYGFLSYDYYLNNNKVIINNYFNNLNYINLLPLYFTTFTIEEKKNFFENDKIRQLFKGEKIINEADKERKDKLIKLQMTKIKNLNENINELNSTINELNDKIDNLNKKNYDLSNKLEDLQDNDLNLENIKYKQLISKIKESLLEIEN